MLRPVEIKPELLGQPLPWDLYDRYGVLLLARGAILEDAAQAARLNARKLFARAEDLEGLAGRLQRKRPRAPPFSLHA